ncbi:hypothetical protein QEN19_002548 [Hanseniaspora menglaensis]
MLQSTFFNLKDLSLEDAAIAASTRLGGAGSSAVSSKDFKKLTISEIKTLLDSNNEVKLKNAMKSIAYKQATGTFGVEKALSLYTYVLKNVNCKDMKTKAMCFDFLIIYMDLDDSAAYLAMNSVQQLLHHKEPQARELALTVLSKFKSKAALPLIMQFSKDMISDFDFKVRRTLSLTFRTCWKQNIMLDEDLSTTLSTLLQDSNYEVVSSCMSLLKDLVYKNSSYLSMLHGFYRRFIRDMDLFEDYCFKDLVEILNRYNSKHVALYSDDYILFTNALEKILIENSSSTKAFQAVITLVANKSIRNKEIIRDALFAILSMNFKFNQIKESILQFMLLVSNDKQYELDNIFSSGTEYLELSLYEDSINVQLLKIQILATNITKENVEKIFKLLQKYSQINNITSDVTSMALHGILECCKLDSTYNSKAMSWIVNFMKSEKCKSQVDVNNAAFSLIRGITSLNSVEDNLPAVYLLTKALLTKQELFDDVYASDLFAETKAGIIWLIGDYATQNIELASHVLKNLLPTFAFEDKSVRLQILTLAAKILLHHKNTSENIEENNVYQMMFESVLQLSKFDAEYDVVDRARTFDGLINKCSNQIGLLLLQAPKNILNYMSIDSSIPFPLKKSLQSLIIDADEIEDAIELRNNETKIRDFSQKYTGISSVDYENHEFKYEKDNLKTSTSNISDTKLLLKSDEHVSIKNKKDYKLKTMEDFFAEESTYKPPQRKVIKKIIVQEETEEDSDDSGEEEYSEEEDDDQESDAENYESEEDSL